MLYKYILRLRPALLATMIKRILRLPNQVVETTYGQFFVDPISNFGQTLLNKDQYEPDMCLTLGTYLKPACVFVDIGANEGFFSVIAAKHVGKAGTVVAVEPQERLLAVLQENFTLNDVTSVVRLVQAVIAASTGDALLYLSPNVNSGSTSLWQATRYNLPTQKSSMFTLADLFEQNDIKFAHLVKMDIEGAEYEAVLGSKNLFENGQIGALALELHPAAIRKRGLDPNDIDSFLRNVGYAIDPRLKNTVYYRDVPSQNF